MRRTRDGNRRCARASTSPVALAAPPAPAPPAAPGVPLLLVVAGGVAGGRASADCTTTCGAPFVPAVGGSGEGPSALSSAAACTTGAIAGTSGSEGAATRAGWLRGDAVNGRTGGAGGSIARDTTGVGRACGAWRSCDVSPGWWPAVPSHVPLSTTNGTSIGGSTWTAVGANSGAVAGAAGAVPGTGPVDRCTRAAPGRSCGPPVGTPTDDPEVDDARADAPRDGEPEDGRGRGGDVGGGSAWTRWMRTARSPLARGGTTAAGRTTNEAEGTPGPVNAEDRWIEVVMPAASGRGALDRTAGPSTTADGSDGGPGSVATTAEAVASSGVAGVAVRSSTGAVASASPGSVTAGWVGSDIVSGSARSGPVRSTERARCSPGAG